MARRKREESKNGIYHVMVRGVNKQVIFNDDLDRLMFIKIIQEAKNKFEFELLAWCLMPNHVHLVPRFASTEDDFSGCKRLSQAMRKINVQYALYFNKKYERVGHLFQNRFRSEAVDDEKYFLTVIRYVNRNPVKAELVRTMDEYDWSSYQQYLFDAVERNDCRFSIADTAFLFSICGETEFIRFCNQEIDDFLNID